MIAETLKTTPWINEPGVHWRWCRFRASSQTHLRDDTTNPPVTVTLPPNMNAAVPQRRGEFLAGRLCATQALRQIGCSGPVGRAGRAPLWPEGVTGSISHAGDMAMAVVSTKHSRLGVDCEWILSEMTTTDIAPLVLSPDDRRACPSGWPLSQFLTLAFSAKEAAYKALSRDLTDIPDFQEATVTHIGPEQLSLSFRGQTLPMAYALKQELVVTLMAQ